MTLESPNIQDRAFQEGFRALSDLAYSEAGLVLSESKAAMINSRLRHRFKALAINNLSDYCAYVKSGQDKDENRHMISALTTNVSGFFREPHHFEQLAEDVIPQMKSRAAQGKPVRLWSAGCSNGQEPYTIAMQLLEAAPELARGDVKILATDIDTNVVRHARQGTYDTTQVSGLSKARLDKFFVEERDQTGEPRYTAKPELKNFISFRELNLMGDWPMRGKFDAIFCRNVVIYFDSETQDRLWPRFMSHLHDHGMIFVGHSERISDPAFKSAGATSYVKANAPEAPSKLKTKGNR